MQTHAEWSDWGGFASRDTWVERVRTWDRRTQVLAVAGVVSFLMLFTGLIPVLRYGATGVAVHVLRFVATPILPDAGSFERLPQPSKVLASDGTLLALVGDENRRRVPLEDIPKHVRQAVMAAEDHNFYRHPGIDALATVRAAWSTVTGDLAGGSTITQQLAKLNYTDGERTFGRKLREFLYAVQLEAKYSKDELLERYVNEVYFGQGAYGIEVASENFFGVSPQELDLAQAATLAGKIRSPERLNPYEDLEPLTARRNSILDAMRSAGWASEDEVAEAREKPVKVVPLKSEGAARNGLAPHFVRFVQREARGLDALGPSEDTRRHQLYVTGGYRIETSLDIDDHREAEDVVSRMLEGTEGPDAAVVSVVPGDGAITVYVAGQDPERRFDVVSVGRRQAGSSFKPYAYLAMLRARVDPQSRFSSESPVELSCDDKPWRIENYGGFSGGLMTVEDALVGSVNVVFAQVTARIGAAAVGNVAVDAGIDERAVDPAVCAMSLGGLREGVTPLEQAAGFATFASGGLFAEPYSIVRITDREGRTVFEREPEARRVFDHTLTGVVNTGLERVVASGTGRAARIGRPVAGKTGTTNDNADAWFVGYVPQLAMAVWVGHPEGRVAMASDVTGGSIPARIFAATMRSALDGVRVAGLHTASTDGLGLEIVNAPPTPSPAPTPTEFAPTPWPPATVSPRPTPAPTHSPYEASKPTPRPWRSPSPSPPPSTASPKPSPSEPPASASPQAMP